MAAASPARPLRRVLFVDDDEIVQKLVQLSLERIGGLTVRVLGDSTMTAAEVGEFAPDLVVLDCMMPGMDGTEVFRALRNSPQTATLPVVFLTVKAHWRTVDELLALGAAGVITKPFSATELAGQLKEIWASLGEGVRAGT